MAATFASTKCSCILEIYKVINFDANLLLASRNSPVKQVTYLSAWLYCCLLFQHGIKNGYQYTNHNIIFALILELKECGLNLCKRFSRIILFNGF